MTQVLVDSDILIEVSRARDMAVLARWEELIRQEVPLLCSPVTVAELWHGARTEEGAELKALFAAMPCIPIDYEIGQRAGDYMRSYAKSHHLELGDALIASTASIHTLELWTRNRRHYPMEDVIFL